MKRVAPDRLFEALDGRHLSAAGADWRVEVYGVIDEPSRRWVQVALDGPPRPKVVTLRLAPTHTPRHAARFLAHWLEHPQDAKDVLTHVA